MNIEFSKKDKDKDKDKKGEDQSAAIAVLKKELDKLQILKPS